MASLQGGMEPETQKYSPEYKKHPRIQIEAQDETAVSMNQILERDGEIFESERMLPPQPSGSAKRRENAGNSV